MDEDKTTWVVIECRGIHEETNPADGVGRTYPAASYQDALKVAWVLSYMWELETEREWEAENRRAAGLDEDVSEEEDPDLSDLPSLLGVEEGWVTPDGRLAVEVIAFDPNTGGPPDDDGGRDEHVVYVPVELHGPKDDPTSFYLLDDEGHVEAVGRKLETRK